MMNKINDFIIKHNMIGHNELVIIALSGGYDSLCLLHIMKGLGLRIRAAHMNHMLRSEALEDLRYIEKICRRWDIPLDVSEHDAAAYAKTHKMSVETAGRELRYKFFAQLANKHKGIIATAHNQNDHAESVIMHLLRGSGMTGLTGIKPIVCHNGARIIRPLLSTSRQEIEGYLDSMGIKALKDATNDTCDYWRNEIRHMVMPPIIERGGLSSISRTTDILTAEDDFFRTYIQSLISEHTTISDGCVSFDNKWFNSLHLGVRRRFIRDLIEQNWRKPLSLLHIDAVLEISRKNYGGKVIQLPDMMRAHLQKGRIIIRREQYD